MWRICGLPARCCCALGTEIDLADARNLMIEWWGHGCIKMWLPSALPRLKGRLMMDCLKTEHVQKLLRIIHRDQCHWCCLGSQDAGS